MTQRFKALVVDEEADGKTAVGARELALDELPPGEVLVDVAYTTLNYKDGLALCGNRGRILRRFPIVPGIDFAGTVAASEAPGFAVGDPVVLTGWGVGEEHWGGMAQKARVRADWLVRLPNGVDPLWAMAIGTAGFTAMLSVMALEEAGLVAGEGNEVLVTGAGGGVGGIATALLAALGHRVVAVTGRPENADYLRELGAREVVGREAVAVDSGRPLDKGRWAAVVDAVGGAVLANCLKGVRDGGAVAASGNAAGIELHTNVLPFILRGVKLLGINSKTAPQPRRQEAWRRLAGDLPKAALERMTTVRPLAEVPELARAIVAGRLRGRTVIDVNA